jgi:hypothetical protein
MFLILKPAAPTGLSRGWGAQALCRAWCLLGLWLGALSCHAQDIEPRRWSHLPLDTNFLGVGYAYTNGDTSSITSPRACG